MNLIGLSNLQTISTHKINLHKNVEISKSKKTGKKLCAWPKCNKFFCRINNTNTRKIEQTDKKTALTEYSNISLDIHNTEQKETNSIWNMRAFLTYLWMTGKTLTRWKPSKVIQYSTEKLWGLQLHHEPLVLSSKQHVSKLTKRHKAALRSIMHINFTLGT